jgi:hypothetical protein
VLGVHLEGPFINPLKPGAMEASFILEGDAALARSWTEKFKIVIATVAPEVPGGLDVTKARVERGCRVQIGHSIATPPVIEEAFHCGCSGFTHLFNAMSHITPEEKHLVLDTCRKNNLPIVSLPVVATGLIDFNEPVRAFHLQRCKAFIDLAAELGAKNILLVLGEYICSTARSPSSSNIRLTRRTSSNGLRKPTGRPPA